MDPNVSTLIFPAFVAGVLTFFAPCTLPLVPGYLAFISGMSLNDLNGAEKKGAARRKVLKNSLLFMLGFSAVFIVFGAAAGGVGFLLSQYRAVLTRIGGIVVITFGLLMLGIFKIPFLQKSIRVRIPTFFTIGKPSSSFVLGAAFATGWTPCIGPILGSIFLIAAVSTSPVSGAFLLAVFSLGLSTPFFLVALGITSVSKYISKISNYLHVVSVIGGIFLVLLGILLLLDKTALLITYGFKFLKFIHYDRILDYL